MTASIETTEIGHIGTRPRHANYCRALLLAGLVCSLTACSGGGDDSSSSSAPAPSPTTAPAPADFLLPAGHSEGYLAPVITYPRPDSETAATARHRINYPGQPYRIPVAVAFGAWPFRYELLTAPTGMTIGSQLQSSGGELVAGPDYGVITWAQPTAGSHSVSVKVTDQTSVVQTVSFTLSVSASGWVFLNPAAATNGSGTLA